MLSAEEHGMLQTVVSYVCSRFHVSDVVTSGRTLSRYDVSICGSSLVSRSLKDNLQLDLDEFCESIRDRSFDVQQLGDGGKRIVCEPRAAVLQTRYIRFETSEPIRSVDGSAFLYVTVKLGRGGGADMMLHLVRDRDEWMVHRRVMLGLRD